ADLHQVHLDKELFKQALLNILLNAEQAMPQGGAITIQASARPRITAANDAGAEAVSADGHRLCLSIIDTGQGMAPDVLAKIFQPFFSPNPNGSGVGLPTTRKIIEAHHGTRDVQSEPGKGTKITI